ncbi:YchJ family protein [soil metagenome]
MKKPALCPCHSGARYAACCAPFHEGSALPETPEALMRSRFAGFALGLGEYLVTTLATPHEDRPLEPVALARELSRAKDRQRFLGLRIVHHAMNGDLGEVLFVARVFERGEDQTFAELSQFVRESGRWGYASGILIPRDRWSGDGASLTLAEFRRLTV